MSLNNIDARVTKFAMRPSDTMLVSSASRLMAVQMGAIHAQVKSVLPPGVKSLIVVQGLAVEVIPVADAVPAGITPG